MPFYNTFFITEKIKGKAINEIKAGKRFVFLRLKKRFFFAYKHNNTYKIDRVANHDFLKELVRYPFKNRRFLLGARHSHKPLIDKIDEHLKKRDGEWPMLCIGEGGFNIVFSPQITPTEWQQKLNYPGRLVYKTALRDYQGNLTKSGIKARMNAPERIVKICGIIYDKKYQITIYQKGVLLPFIVGREPIDSEMVIIILELYKKCGRVFVDPFNYNIFITQTNHIMITDFDLILDLKNSLDSRNFYFSYEKTMNNFKKYYNDHGQTHPHTVEAVKNLLWLENQFFEYNITIPDNFITALSPTLIKEITLYREESTLKIHYQALINLIEERAKQPNECEQCKKNNQYNAIIGASDNYFSSNNKNKPKQLAKPSCFYKQPAKSDPNSSMPTQYLSNSHAPS